MSKPDRFKLEDAIYKTDMSEDIGMLMKQYLDGPKMTEDQLANHLMGLEYMAKLRWQNLFDVFTEQFKLDSYADRSTGFTGDIKIDFGAAQPVSEFMRSSFDDAWLSVPEEEKCCKCGHRCLKENLE